MRRALLLLTLAGTALGLVPAALTAASAAPAPTLDRGAAVQMLAMVNAERVARGLVPLQDDPALRGWAEKWSLHMGTTGVLAHNDALFTRSAHRSLGIKVFAENVAWDDAVFGIVGAHKQFMDSHDHYANMLGSGYRLAGFAVARDSKGRVWVTEDFGTPRVTVTPPPPPPAPKPAVKPAAKSAPRPAAAVTVARVVAPRPVAKPRMTAAAIAPAPIVRFAPVRDHAERNGSAPAEPVVAAELTGSVRAGSVPTPLKAAPGLVLLVSAALTWALGRRRRRVVAAAS